MFLDSIVATGWLVAGLLMTFLTAVGLFIWKDSTDRDN